MIKSRVATLLGIEYPVILGSMSWCTSAELAAAVSNAGGLGQLGPNAGQREITNNPEETANRMREEIKKTRLLTNRPFTINYMLPNPAIPFTVTFSDPMRELVLEDKDLKIVLASGEMYEEDIKLFKKEGKTVIYRDANPTVESFRKAEAAGADMVIATSVDCGGHLPEQRIGLTNILQIAKETVSIPVIAAGGIVNAQGVKTAFHLGAEGVYIGTLFLASKEAPVAQSTKEVLVNSNTDGLVEYRGVSGFMRCLPNRITRRCAELTYSGADIMEIAGLYSGGFRTGMLLGDHENGIVSVSSAIGQIKEIRSCEQILQELIKGME